MGISHLKCGTNTAKDEVIAMATERGLARRQRREIEQAEPWNTFRDMERMFRDFFTMPAPLMRPRWISEFAREFAPEVDLKETKDEFVLSATVPGMEKDDIEIDVTRDRITICGERRTEEEKPEEQYHLRQQSYGSFRVSYSLPADVKPDDVKATYKNGILNVHMPKAEVAEAKKVHVESSE